MNISFDNVDLMVSPYIVRYLKHDSWPDRSLEREKLAGERGTVVVNSQFGEKIFEITGKITGTSQDNLEANVDTFKELLSRKGKNLDIGYAGYTRRYVSFCDDVKVDRDFYHLLYAPFSAKFIVPSGIAINPVVVNHSHNDETGASYTGSLTVAGTTDPKPTITITIDAANSATKLELTVNGDKITLTHSLATSDIIVIDCENKKLTLNGVEHDYSGIFPRFLVGSNSYTVDITRTSCTYDIDIDYYNTYL